MTENLEVDLDIRNNNVDGEYYVYVEKLDDSNIDVIFIGFEKIYR